MTTGRLQKQTLPNGAYTTYEYNARGQVESMSHYKADATLLAEYTDITYDGVGNITGFIVSLPTMPQYSGTKTFHYDGKGRLDEETFTPDGQYTTDYDYTYGYDPAGNATVFKGTQRHYNSNNQWTEELVNGNWEIMATYDGAGNPTSYNGHTLEFDAENRLTDFDNGDLLAGYDGDGLRAWNEVNGQRTHFVLDGTNVVGELNNNGTARFTNNFGPNGLISRYNNTSQTTVYYLFDPLGNVQHRLDGTGAILSSDVYDAWGNVIAGGDPSDPFGYKAVSGYYTDQETGLILCGRRYYDPTTGRWINRDPIGYSGGINQYVYCEDNPVNEVDFDGTAPKWVLTAGDWVDENLMFGMAESFGDAVGRYESGNGSLGEVAWKGTVVTVLIVGNAVGIGKGIAQVGVKVAANVGRAAAGKVAGRAVEGLAVGSYSELKALLGGRLKNLGLEVHHLIEKRLADALKLDPDDIVSVVISNGKNGAHSPITQALRNLIPYGSNYAQLGAPEIMRRLYTVYKSDPVLVQVIRDYLKYKAPHLLQYFK